MATTGYGLLKSNESKQKLKFINKQNTQSAILNKLNAKKVTYFESEKSEKIKIKDGKKI